MRASSLSNDKVIELLNHFFIPVYLSNEDFAKGGCAPPDERKELQRIFRETLDARRSAGSVHAYLMGPDGKAYDSMHVANAAKVEKLLAMLESAVAHYQLAAGRTLFPPGEQSKSPKAAPGSLVLHLVARNVVKQGTAWQLDAELAAKLLVHFYPTTENNDVKKNKILKQDLNAKVVSHKDGVARAQLTGQLKMEHWFYHKADGNVVDTQLAGYLDFEPATGRIRGLRLITEDATYNRRPFGVALSLD
jgi:hypothetical protein